MRETGCGARFRARYRDLDFRAFFAGLTDALGFFSPSSGIGGTLFSMMNCFPHCGHVRWLDLITSITVAIIRGNAP
jgi:hypothetical protein